MNFQQEKLQRLIRECDRHCLRIHDSAKQMQAFMPLSTASYLNLSKLQVQIIDQFLFRFIKLQDSMGERLFKAVLLLLEEEVANKPFIDILNRLEQLEILSSADDWRALRDIRNIVAHTYDDEPEEAALAINKIFSKREDLLFIFQNIKAYLSNKNV